MAFEYGVDAPDIKNPFKQEGLLYIVNGSFISIIGVLSVITLRKSIVLHGTGVGWFGLVFSLALLTVGMQYLGKGWLRRSRFYVGRGIPSSLAQNVSRSEGDTAETGPYYSDGQIEQMILGRKNTTFQEPVTLIDRMMYNIFPRLLFLPYSMRNSLHIIARNTAFSFVALFVYLLALLSSSIGLTALTETSFSYWLGIVLCLFLVSVWFGTPISVKKINEKELKRGKNAPIAWVIAISILFPAVAEVLIRQGITLPAAPFNPVWAIVLAIVMALIVCITSLSLGKMRADLTNPTTRISEYRDHWQESVHPKDFFRSLDIELANIRYRDIPNRVYRELRPDLQMEGSSDKGSFTGDTIQETQPMYEEREYPEPMKKLRFSVAVTGHVFVLLAAILLYLCQGSMELEVGSIFSTIFYPGVFWLFGSALLLSAHLYWGEMLFRSYLIQFRGEGTYTESKLSVGMAITDSTQSENTIVRTSYSPWLIVSQIISSTHAKPGANSFSNARYVLSMEEGNHLLYHLIDTMKGFIDDRELVATTASDRDMETIQKFNALNDKGISLQNVTNRTAKTIPDQKNKPDDGDEDDAHSDSLQESEE